MALAQVVDLVGQAALAPDVGVLDAALEAFDEPLDLLGDIGKIRLLDVGPDYVKDLVVAKQLGWDDFLSSLWEFRPRSTAGWVSVPAGTRKETSVF